MAPERLKKASKEVGKLLKAESIREVQFPYWLANVVLVKNSNNRWRLCSNFTDLNKACLEELLSLTADRPPSGRNDRPRTPHLYGRIFGVQPDTDIP